jgi:hypothetical protein
MAIPNEQNVTTVHQRLRTGQMAMLNEQNHIIPRKEYLSKEQVGNNGAIHIRMSRSSQMISATEKMFDLTHTKLILLSDLEVFEVRYVIKSGVVIGVAEEFCETGVAYVVSERQCQEVSHKRWKTHLETLKKAEKEKPTAAR